MRRSPIERMRVFLGISSFTNCKVRRFTENQGGSLPWKAISLCMGYQGDYHTTAFLEQGSKSLFGRFVTGTLVHAAQGR